MRTRGDGAVAVGLSMPGSRDGVCIAGYVPLELAIAVLEATTVGILAVVDADAKCIGYVRCADDADRSRAYPVAPGAGHNAVIGSWTCLAPEASIADALRSLRSEGRTRAVVTDRSGRRMGVLSAPRIPAEVPIQTDAAFVTEWDARLG